MLKTNIIKLKALTKITSLFIAVLFSANFIVKAQSQLNNQIQQPNIIVILVDDLGYDDVGFNGGKDVPTPNIDKIASEGVKFTNAYVSYPVCGPSRAGLITGRYQDRFGFGRNPLFAPNDLQMGLPLGEQTLATALKQSNYKSVAIGKWHLGAHKSLHPLKRGFNDFFGFLSGGHQYFPENLTLENEFEVKKQFDAYKTKLLKNNTRVEEHEYLTDALSREAVNYIDKYKNESFFIYLAYNAPHAPLQATEKYLNRFDSIKDPDRKTYAAMVSAVDDGVGQILNKLNELELSDNTLIFFLSDNGGPEQKNASNNGLLKGGKGDVFEGGIRVPFAMKWPSKIPSGKIYDKPIISLDIFATVIAQTEDLIQTKNPIDGVNLIPFLTDKTSKNPHDYLFWRKFDAEHYTARNTFGEKIVKRNNENMLFNLKEDISESNNLQTTNSELFNAIQKRYEQWEAQMLNPIFLGLNKNKTYNRLHPKRFTQKNN